MTRLSELQPPMSMSPRLPVFLSLTLALCVAGCGDDDEGAVVVSLGPPAMSVASPADGACVVLQDDPGATVRVRIELQNWLLRPFGYCGGVYSQCGFAVFLVDGQEVARGAALVTDVPFAGLPSPAGSHRVRVELRNDADVVVLDRAREPLADEVSVITVAAGESCP
jgi:hypothetical protein